MEIPIDFKKVKASVKNVRINGLGTTKDEYVKHHLADIFNASNFEEVLERSDRIRKSFYTLGCFSAVDVLIDASKDQPSHVYDINIDVQELGNVTGGLQTSIGNNGGSLSSSINFPNLFGRGQKITGEYSYGTRNHVDYRLSYSSPFEYDPYRNFVFSVFRNSNEFSWSKYKEMNNGIVLEIFRPYVYSIFKDKYQLKGTHNFTYEAVWRHLVSNLDSSFAIREHSGHSLKSSIKYSNIIDRRDRKALPTKGGYLNTSVELAGIGGDVRFLRFNTDYLYTKTFLKYFTTQFTFSSGFIKALGGKDAKIAVNDRFFLGGPLSLRGFENRGAGPQKENCSLGNDSYWLLGAHLYTPLPFLHNNTSLSSWLKTHSFINVGNILSINKSDSQNDRTRLEHILGNSRLSIGTGIVLAFGNIARVELNYVLPILKLNTDKINEGLQFGIGINFN